MILKEADDRSADLAELQRLKAAAPASFHSVIERQIGNIRSGAAGERSTAHFLSREFGQGENFAIIHDLRIGVDGDYAQIDHLLIHRVQAAAWVLETKNHSGRLSCDEHGDWTISRNGKPQPIPSPINQARRQCQALRLWLKSNDVVWLREIHPVVLISPNASVDRRKLPSDTHVVKSDNFAEWWKGQAEGLGLVTALGMLGPHMVNGMSHDEFRALGQRLVSAHEPARFDWHAKLRLPRSTNLKQTSDSKQPVAEAPKRGAVTALPADVPQIITTPHGEIRIARIPDGRYAFRNDKSDLLIEVVKNACKGRAQWNPRFRNWLVSEAELPEVLAAIAHSQDV